jgi:hypothetical protein
MFQLDAPVMLDIQVRFLQSPQVHFSIAHARQSLARPIPMEIMFQPDVLAMLATREL